VLAVVVDEFGGPDMLELQEVEDPVPGPGQVVIAVHAAGANRVDAGNRADGTWAGLAVPFIPGYDVAGRIEAIGPAVAGLAVGDRVMAMTPFPRGAGGYAELVAVGAAAVAPLADTVSYQDAAATPLAAGTALTVLERLACPPDSWLLVLGASGGVGLFLLQLAAKSGVRTIAVGRQEMHATMRSLGATACIDYIHEDVARRTLDVADGPVDAVADLVGGTGVAATLACVRPGGSIASIETPGLDFDALIDGNLTFHGVLVRNDAHRLRQLAGLLGDGSLRPVVSQVLPLSEAARAHRLLEHGPTRGKIVFQVRDDPAQ
jgi:NADPH2:quinone reductase